LLPGWPVIPGEYCPVHFIHDEDELSLPTIDVDLLEKIAVIAETDSFSRTLSKLPKPIQNSWSRAKERLALSTRGKGLDFKLWERRGNERIRSLRLSRNYRVHLREVASGDWFAEAVGSHKQMGHG